MVLVEGFFQWYDYDVWCIVCIGGDEYDKKGYVDGDLCIVEMIVYVLGKCLYV